jgi:hypothetical protein
MFASRFHSLLGLAPSTAQTKRPVTVVATVTGLFVGSLPPGESGRVQARSVIAKQGLHHDLHGMASVFSPAMAQPPRVPSPIAPPRDQGSECLLMLSHYTFYVKCCIRNLSISKRRGSPDFYVLPRVPLPTPPPRHVSLERSYAIIVHDESIGCVLRIRQSLIVTRYKILLFATICHNSATPPSHAMRDIGPGSAGETRETERKCRVGRQTGAPRVLRS